MSGPAPGATGVGSLPGTDPAESVRMVLGELPDLPFLPELPARGVGADLVGRSAALLAEQAVDLQPSGWRLVSRPGRDQRRASDLLQRDLDALEDAAQQGFPPAIKLSCAGPWTLAATLQLPRGERALSDHGAVADLAGALAEGLLRHVADVGRRLPPGTAVHVQLDEPALPAVLAARVPTASGFGRLRVPDLARARAILASVLAPLADREVTTLVHCCATEIPVELLVEAGASGVSLDATLLTPRDDDAVGRAVELGHRLLLGVVPALPDPGGRPIDLDRSMRTVTTLWGRLGFPLDQLGSSVVITPTCGLAGASAGHARAALAACVEIARRLGEGPE